MQLRPSHLLRFSAYLNILHGDAWRSHGPIIITDSPPLTVILPPPPASLPSFAPRQGRPVDDAPLSKEEQLLGYTASQRQRMKALHTLGLTEESFERCRALMLSSLGPTAFGTDVDKTAENAARAAEEEGWTPSTKTRRWYSHSIPDVNGLFRPKSFNYGHL